MVRLFRSSVKLELWATGGWFLPFFTYCHPCNSTHHPHLICVRVTFDLLLEKTKPGLSQKRKLFLLVSACLICFPLLSPIFPPSLSLVVCAQRTKEEKGGLGEGTCTVGALDFQTPDITHTVDVMGLCPCQSPEGTYPSETGDTRPLVAVQELKQQVLL